MEQVEQEKKLHSLYPLSQEQINLFLSQGILVVDDILNEKELHAARQGLNDTMKKYDVDPDDLSGTAQHLKKLSSTNGSGGVLDIFYPTWKMEVATNPKFFSVISQLWKASFSHESQQNEKMSSVPKITDATEHPQGQNDDKNEQSENYTSVLYPKPFGEFSYHHGFAYIDRIGYRIPTELSEKIGKTFSNNDEKTSKKKRSRPIQRSLTPHLDCCPATVLSGDYSHASKWRPFQSFISLTDTLLPNTGGFEAVPGFHRIFTSWAACRQPAIVKKRNGTVVEIPPPCVGEFTPIRPIEDKQVLQRITHIPCKAGSAVIWDNRIPHANSFRNDSSIPRAVVYASFLPNVPLNRKYVSSQMQNYSLKRKPNDQWIELAADDDNKKDELFEDEPNHDFSNLGRLLMSMDGF